jgi:organic hydroperoxide reductase OsmC/OhrA|tara:strand:- start:26330 stop:26743 length:414 start_codon:yes stop_codon:yes gene_type:complete
MGSTTVTFANVEGTEAAMGWAGSHTVVADRPAGKDGGMGLGFNGGQLLALSIGACFCNDLRSIAHERGVALHRISVSVTLDFDGMPARVTGGRMVADLATDRPEDSDMLLAHAREITTIGNSVQQGFPMVIEAGEGG